MKTEPKIKKWHLEICKQEKKTQYQMLSLVTLSALFSLVLSVQFMDICQFHFLNISTLNFDAKAIVHILLPVEIIILIAISWSKSSVSLYLLQK